MHLRSSRADASALLGPTMRWRRVSAA